MIKNSYILLRSVALLAFIASTLFFTSLEAIKDADGETKNILFLAGDTKHRHGFHEYKAGSILLANAINESGLPVKAKVHWYGWPKNEKMFDDVDACIIYADSGGDFGEKYSFLDQKIKNGMGIMFMHYGVHPTRKLPRNIIKIGSVDISMMNSRSIHPG